MLSLAGLVLILAVVAAPAPLGALAQAASPSAVPAAGAAAGGQGALLDFDIPAEPLGVALDEYAKLTGLPALVPSDLIRGRMSSAVRGLYAPEAALQMLLQGTGLMASGRSSVFGRTFVLQETGSAEAASSDDRLPLSALFNSGGYAGLAQARIWERLCKDPRTQPGGYSALVRFRLGEDGRVRDARLLGTSGNAARDEALLSVLGQVRIERVPPAAIGQRELTLAIVPNDPATGPPCGRLTGGEGGSSE